MVGTALSRAKVTCGPVLGLAHGGDRTESGRSTRVVASNSASWSRAQSPSRTHGRLSPPRTAQHSRRPALVSRPRTWGSRPGLPTPPAPGDGQTAWPPRPVLLTPSRPGGARGASRASLGRALHRSLQTWPEPVGSLRTQPHHSITRTLGHIPVRTAFRARLRICCWADGKLRPQPDRGEAPVSVRPRPRDSHQTAGRTRSAFPSKQTFLTELVNGRTLYIQLARAAHSQS